uniref:Uncharacterized protein n=1 Tax=Onchocerca volvulus TaxID=6282 RepID=A0A8R1TXK9_ONCVO
MKGINDPENLRLIGQQNFRSRKYRYDCIVKRKHIYEYLLMTILYSRDQCYYYLRYSKRDVPPPIGFHIEKN